MKNGRPRKTLSDLRIIEVQIRMNEAEFKYILEKALSLNMQISTYMRSHCLDHRIITFGEDISILLFELGKIGVNLNQYMKVINSLKNESHLSVDMYLSKSKAIEIDEALKFIDQARKHWIDMTNAV